MKFKKILRFSLILIYTLGLLSLSIVPVTAAEPELKIITWNLEWFFDANFEDNSDVGKENSAPDSEEYQSRVEAIAEAIHEIKPTILALQEIENKEVVQDLADSLEQTFNLKYNVAFVQGEDTFTGQDVAYLVAEGIPFEVSRFNYPPTGSIDGENKDLSKHAKLETIIDDENFTLINVHLITRSNDRLKQAKTLRAWIDNDIDPSHNLIVLGDFNAGQKFNQTTPNSDIGIIRGFQTPSLEDDLFDVHQLVNPRATHASNNEYDRILLSASLRDIQGLKVNNAEIRRDLAIRGVDDDKRGVDYALPVEEQDLSDHFPLIVTLN